MSIFDRFRVPSWSHSTSTTQTIIGNGNVVSNGDISSKTLQGSGRIVTESRDLKTFSQISFGGSITVTIHVGPGDQRVIIKGDDNIVPKIETIVQNGELVVSFSEGYSTQSPLSMEIWVSKLEKADVSGISTLNADGLLEKDLKIDLSGASKANLKGNVDSLEIDCSGVTNADCHQLLATKVKCDLSGASKAKVKVAYRLKADVSGVSELTYFGTPRETKLNTSGVGKITGVKG